MESSLQIISNLNEPTQNQIDELKKKMNPIEQMIISLRPKKKFSLIDNIPDLDYDNEIQTNDNDDQFSSSSVETYENDIGQEPLSNRLYKEIDGKTTRMYREKFFLFVTFFVSF